MIKTGLGRSSQHDLHKQNLVGCLLCTKRALVDLKNSDVNTGAGRPADQAVEAPT